MADRLRLRLPARTSTSQRPTTDRGRWRWSDRLLGASCGFTGYGMRSRAEFIDTRSLIRSTLPDDLWRSGGCSTLALQLVASGILRPGLEEAQRTLLRGYRALEKLRAVPRLKVPEPPAPADWRVWHHYRRLAHCKYDALAAPDSPVRSALRGKSRESRRQLAMRAVKRVDTFRLRCRRARRTWWFKIFDRLMSDPIQ